MREHLARLRAFLSTLSGRRPELAIVVFGILLRLSLNITFGVEYGYDWYTHHDYVKWIVDHGELPRFDYNAASYHPPLYYWLAAALQKAGAENQTLGWISILAGCLRLVVVWAGLELYLPGRRFARLVALGLLAIFPADLHLDGMGSNEALSTLFTALAALLLPLALGTDRPQRRRHLFGIALGVAVGLGLLTKISMASLIFAAALAAGVGLVRAFLAGTRTPRALFARVAPLVTALAVTGAISGWFFARNYRLYGMASPTGFDGWAKPVVVDFMKAPFLDRRTLGYFVNFDTAVFNDPYYPTSSLPYAYFPSLLVATTFSDYFNFFFGAAMPGEPLETKNHRPMRASSFELSLWSVRGGAILAVLAIAAWLVAVRRMWRRPDDARLVLLLIPLLAVLGQLTFAIKYPNDTYGPVKGAYLQFGMPPVFALVGLATAWAWQRGRRRWRALAVAAIAAQLAVATYSLQCRLPHIWPLLQRRMATPPPPPPKPAPPATHPAPPPPPTPPPKPIAPHF
jgi:4-amino-4-deoxy-L-arabinose transferase-like glycosyltransferase